MKYSYYLKKFWMLYLFTVVICISGTVGAEKAVSTIAESKSTQRYYTIIIDAGHGGVDGGATSCTGVLESHINLEIALRLEDLCHLLGFKTRMIRTTDESIYTEGKTIATKKASDLRQRVHIVNGIENGILLSIHQNIFADSQYAGAQVFYAPTDGSQELAKILQGSMVENLNPGSKRQCKAASGIYLLQHIQRPGVLIECGFLSNPEEESKLREKTYQLHLCSVIVSGLSRYLYT